ncbi:MAG: ATP-binding protein [Pseudomonadota bacterium]
MDKLDQFFDRAERLIDRLEAVLPSASPTTCVEWEDALAFRWERRSSKRALRPLRHLHPIRLDDLRGIEGQKLRVVQNTKQFVAGRPANNVLLTGARGTGKSSLVKAVLNAYADQGLRLIEVGKTELVDLPDIVELVATRPERFILYCDDLAFNAEEPGYQALKAALDGSVTALSDNLLIYATSNRRHLMPEFMEENLATRYVGEEVHPAEGVEEKISLSERFGLWVSFYPFSQDEYLDIVCYWLHRLDPAQTFDENVRREALQWSLGRGSRSGRVAWQFARDWIGRME